MRRVLFVVMFGVFLCSGMANATLIDNGDGTITQIRSDGSQLMWLQNANMFGRTNWYEAMDWAEDLIFAGYDDWRLPDAHNLDGSGPDQG